MFTRRRRAAKDSDILGRVKVLEERVMDLADKVNALRVRLAAAKEREDRRQLERSRGIR